MRLVSGSDVRSAAASALLWIACACACGPSASVSLPAQSNHCSTEAAPPDGLATVLLGRDVTGAFQPLRDGDAMPIANGPQGGQHVYVSVRLYSPVSESWAYSLTLASPSGATLGSTKIALAACGPGWTLSEKVRVVLSTSAPASGSLTLSAAPVGASTSGDGGAPLTESVSVSVQ